MKALLKKLAKKTVKPNIVFESIPDFSDNTKAVFDEMVRRGYDKKYRLIWFTKWNQCAEIKNGKIIYWNPRERNGFLQRVRNYCYYNNTKCIVCCNRYTVPGGNDPVPFTGDFVSFYLSHGTPIKSVKSYYSCPEIIDYVLSPAHAVDYLMAYEFSVDPEKIFTAGFPRNDVFARPPIDLREKINCSFDKFVVWYPTYRQNVSKSINTNGSSMPIIHDVGNAIRLNEIAEKNSILIIFKPHFAQDVSLIKELKLSNIMFIDDTFFKKFGFTSYEMLAASDALITDYSSVYYDYTLCNKPIGVIWEDIESYKTFPGFAVDLEYFLKGAEKIYNLEELCSFIENVAAGKDKLITEREEIRDVVNYSTDGKNAERVVDFIVQKAKL